MNLIANWLYKQKNHKILWIGGGCILILLVLAEFFIHLHSAFHAFEWLSFNSVFGFFSCVLMVVIAKILGYIIKRPEDYYD